MKEYTVKDVLIYVRDKILPADYNSHDDKRNRRYLCNAVSHKRCIYRFGKQLCTKALSYLYEQKPSKVTGMNSSFTLGIDWEGGCIWWNTNVHNFNRVLKEKRKFLTHIMDKL